MEVSLGTALLPWKGSCIKILMVGNAMEAGKVIKVALGLTGGWRELGRKIIRENPHISTLLPTGNNSETIAPFKISNALSQV